MTEANEKSDWHFAYIPVDKTQRTISAPYYDMVNWCIDNIGMSGREWICTGDIQVSDYWVFGFIEESDAVHFKMVWL